MICFHSKQQVHRVCKVFQCTLFILNYCQCYQPDFYMYQEIKVKYSIFPHKGRKHYGLWPQFLCNSTALCCLKSSPIFFIISKINDHEAKSFSLLRNKILNEIGWRTAALQRGLVYIFWTVGFTWKDNLAGTVAPSSEEERTLSLSALFSKKKAGTLYFVVGVSVNIKLPHGKSPTAANCRVK